MLKEGGKGTIDVTVDLGGGVWGEGGSDGCWVKEISKRLESCGGLRDKLVGRLTRLG